jgi:hypothetical protein
MKKIIVALLFTLSSVVFSQEEKIKTEIVTIALDEFVDGKFFHNGKDIVDFSANPTAIGEVMAYEGPPRLVIRNTQAEFSQKEPLPAPTAWVDLPAKTNRVLLACLKSKDKPMKIVAYDIGSAKLGLGDYRVFNFSRSTTSLILGSEKRAVNSGSNEIVSSAKWKKTVMELDVMIAMVKDNKAKPVYSSQWGHRPGRRNYIFIFDGPYEYKPLHICRFYDVPPVVAKNES